MITVVIYINGVPVYTRSAVNQTPKDVETAALVSGAKYFKSTYKVDDGTTLHHKKSDGAVKLAIQMLKTIKEPG